MATELELCPDRTKMLARILRDGTTVWTDRLDPDSAKGRLVVCRKAGVRDEWLLALIQTVRSSSRPEKAVVCEDSPDKPAFLVRRLTDTRDSATRHEVEPGVFVKDVLPSIPTDHVAEWVGPEWVCCLDVDYHDVAPPAADWLRSVVYNRIAPKPVAWHLSRGGGLHLFYIQSGPYAADELAAVAALRFRSIDSSAGLELKTVVRGPGEAEVIHTGFTDTSSTVLSDWFGSDEPLDETARDEWLESEGMVIGGRYDHDKCPINPTPGHASKGGPVTVSEHGVYCHRCAGLGYTMGCRRPGFAGWPALLGAPSSGDLGAMVRNLCHWGHAKWVLTEKYGMPSALARKAYKAALKTYHRDKKTADLIDGVWDKNTEDMARVNNLWFNIKDSYPYPKDIQNILQQLPAAQTVGDDGLPKPNAASVCYLNQSMDLTQRGYPPIECIHGFRITAPFLGPQGHKAHVTVVNPELARLGTRFTPRYVKKTERMPADEAWATIDTVVPGIDRTLVQVALCAFGSAQETQSGMIPLVFVEGPTGSAKTSTLKIAAGIIGARTGDAVFSDNPERMRQALYQAAQDGPAVLCNELLKDAARSRMKLSEKDALDPVLNLTKDSMSWIAYRGPVRFGKVPSVWITEPQCPLTIRDESQLARRIRHWRLHDRKDAWKATLAAARLSDLHLIRSVSQAVNRACDSIMSEVCDTFFAVPMTWDEQADALGVRTIEESPNFDSPLPSLITLFKLVCAAPDLPPKKAERYGVGFKQIDRAGGEEDELAGFYSMFADGLGADWVKSRKLQERDWSAILKVPVDVRFDMKSDGSSVYVRFATGPQKAPHAVNGAVRNPEELT